MLLLPYLAPSVVTPLAGLLADHMIKRGVGVARVRKLMSGIGLLGPAATFLVLVFVPKPSTLLATTLSTVAVRGSRYRGVGQPRARDRYFLRFPI